MKKMKLFVLLALLMLFFMSVISCNKNDDNCIDSNLVGNADGCMEIYDPVCGCDGITYDNYCVADSSGVTSYVEGECCD